jgi:hypothetical protein
LEFFNVTVLPCNNDALGSWPIKKLRVKMSHTFPDLAPYLESPTMRTAQELMEISVSAKGDEEKKAKLDAHDGDYLPLVKEKFPLQSKFAMLSVVASRSSLRRSVSEVKAINKLDANVLSRIFAFASPPERRTVCCQGWE